MITEQDQAYLEGAKNLWRFGRSTWIDAGIYFAIFATVALIAYVVPHILTGHPVDPCGTIGCHTTNITLNPNLHVPNPQHVPSFTYNTGGTP